jgi:hypothetical protein
VRRFLPGDLVYLRHAVHGHKSVPVWTKLYDSAANPGVAVHIDNGSIAFVIEQQFDGTLLVCAGDTFGYVWNDYVIGL